MHLLQLGHRKMVGLVRASRRRESGSSGPTGVFIQYIFLPPLLRIQLIFSDHLPPACKLLFNNTNGDIYYVANYCVMKKNQNTAYYINCRFFIGKLFEQSFSVLRTQELLTLYQEIGNLILKQEKQGNSGTEIIEALSGSLKELSADIRKFSPENLRYMRAFAIACEEASNPIIQMAFYKLSWSHLKFILRTVKEAESLHFYVRQTWENGWSLPVMTRQIKSGLYERQGRLPSNFRTTISDAQYDRVQQAFKDPYILDFLCLPSTAKERDVEQALIRQMPELQQELGSGFAFVKRQQKMVNSDKGFFCDLVFYHTGLKRNILIDIKVVEFKPESLVKIRPYLPLADEQLRQDGDGESLGLILCTSRQETFVAQLLKDFHKPMGIE